MTEGIDLQDAPGSQIGQHGIGMPFICANFGESITICSILLRKSPTMLSEYDFELGWVKYP